MDRVVVRAGSLWKRSAVRARPTPSEPASNVRIEARRSNQPVLIQNSAGDVLLDGVTASDGSFVIDELLADSIVTVDLPTDVGRELTSFFGLLSDEVVVLGPPSPPEEEQGSAVVTFHFSQLPGAASYQLSVGARCQFTTVEHDPTQPSRVVQLEPDCSGANRFARVVALSSDLTAVGIAGALVDIPSTAPVSVEVGPWHTDTNTLRVVADVAIQSISVNSYKDRDLLSFFVDHEPTEVEFAFLSPSDVLDETFLSVILTDGRSFALRTTESRDIVIDANELPAVEEIDLQPGQQAAASFSWQYPAAPVAMVARYHHLQVGLNNQFVRRAVSFAQDCQLSLPPLPARYQIPDPPESESLGVEFIHGTGVTRDDVRRLIADARDLPNNVLLSSAQGWAYFNRAPSRDPSKPGASPD